MDYSFPLMLAQGGGDVPPVGSGGPAPAGTPAAPAPAAPGTTVAPGAPVNSPTAGTKPQGLLDLAVSFAPFIIIIAVFWFMIMGPQRKEKKKRESMLAALAKGDRVLTLGGIIGTVTEMRDTDVTLKVDENSGTRIKFSRAAIQTVLSDKE